MPHTEHDDFLVRCDPCRVVFPTVSSLENHFRIHAGIHPGSEAPPNSPTFPTTIRETPLSSPEDRNLFCSGPLTASQDQRSDVSSLPPGQHPPPYMSTQAPAEVVHLRQLLLDATTHLVWLAASAARQLSVQPHMPLMSFIRQTNLALLAPVSGTDIDFRQRLAADFYARQLYRQVLLRARISYGDSVRLSVCPSVRLSRPGGIPSTGEIETPGLHIW